MCNIITAFNELNILELAWWGSGQADSLYAHHIRVSDQQGKFKTKRNYRGSGDTNHGRVSFRKYQKGGGGGGAKRNIEKV